MRGNSQRLLLVSGSLLAAAALLAGCGDDGGDDQVLDDLADESDAADWSIRPGVELVTVSEAEPGQELSLYDATGDVLFTTPADDEGRAHIAYIPDEPLDGTFQEAIEAGVNAGETLQPGEYIIRDDTSDPPLATDPFTVAAYDDHPDESLYEPQELRGAALDVLGSPIEGVDLTDGYQYIEVRDGVELSVMVRFPDESLYGEAPWPTVVELSGYGPSDPHSEEPGSLLARSLGYATVNVNLRGTGCSGGVFDTFNPAQMSDGYDVIEVVARQPWVLNEQVGMVGLSYSGITQMYTAATQPPGLAAITAQSVIADPWLQQWPGGIYNDGFTREWLEERERQAGTGAGWVAERIDDGDEQCEANVADHDLNIDFAAFGRALDMRLASADDRDLRLLAGDIDTAVFLSGAFQDEQTGPQFGALLDEMDQAQVLRANLWNGRHPDGYSTMNIMDMYEFLELYVAERVPEFPEAIRGVVETEVSTMFGFPDADLSLAENRLADEFGDDYEAALAFYEDEDPVRLVLGNGLGTDETGAPGGYDEVRLEGWPVPEAEATTWHLGDEGVLDDDEATEADSVSFTFDPNAGSERTVEDYSVLDGVPEYDWEEFPDGTAASFETEPFDDDVLVAGPGYAELWVEVDGPEADLQVSISEVRPGEDDGDSDDDRFEHLVQSGWLRLGHRAEDEGRSSELEVVHPFTDEHYEPMPEGEMLPVRVAIPATGHAFAEGSTLKLTVSSPGRNHVRWTFEPPDGIDDDLEYTLGLGGDTPSQLVLPVLEDVEVDVPSEVPCPGQRGISCRPLD